MQALGKVAYGTWLGDIPSNLFVFLSFALTAVFFLVVSGREVGERAWGPLLLLNVATAVTFIAFFYALKLIEPAIVGAVDIGVGPIIVVLITLATTGERPTHLRIVVCLGILFGCAMLSLAALQGTGFASFGPQAWSGLGASMVAGVGAVFITLASRTLLSRGWRFGAVLAHRFYLILIFSSALAFGSGEDAVSWTGGLVAVLLAVSIIGVLAPLYLLQIGVGRCDPYTVMVTMAAQPMLTLCIEGFSPAYTWSSLTAIGVAIVSGFLILDVAAGRR
jgi:drug/metabolite transporter (DMT)-like permease